MLQAEEEKSFSLPKVPVPEKIYKTVLYKKPTKISGFSSGFSVIKHARRKPKYLLPILETEIPSSESQTETESISHPTDLIRKKENPEIPKIYNYPKTWIKHFRKQRERSAVEENENPNGLCVNEEMRCEGKHKQQTRETEREREGSFNQSVHC